MIIFEFQKGYFRSENRLVDVGKQEVGSLVQERVIIYRRGGGSLNKESGNGVRKKGMDLRGIYKRVQIRFCCLG